MPGKERKQKNNPGNYTADLWENQIDQTRQATRKRRGKNGTVLIGGVPHVQSTLFHGEEMRVPFPAAPINNIPDRAGMTATPGTLFSRPTAEPQSTQDALFDTVPDTATPTSQPLTTGQNEQERLRPPLPVDPQVGEIPEDLTPFVTYVPLHLLSKEQKRKGLLPYVTTRFYVYYSERFGYVPGIILESEESDKREPMSYGVTSRPDDIHAAYEKIRKVIDVQGLRQPIAQPEKNEPLAEPQPTIVEEGQNPLLAILKEDEIYVDPFEVTIEEAEEKGYPLLRRDIVTYKWWLDFPFDTREQPELYEALKANKWKWGGYRKQWYNPAHFPALPKGMYYGNAGGAYYSEENAERIEARATRARETSTAHLERSDQLASIIPFGQPMMPNHYSYRSDLAYRKKIWRQMDLFVEFYKKAEWLEGRAEGSRRLQRRKSNLSMMQNRLDRLQADVRSFRRGYEEAKAKGAEQEYDYYKRHLTILATEILPLQVVLAERGGLPIEKVEAARPLQPGDYILMRGRGVYVAKVNPKTIKVLDPKVHYANGEMWELTYKKSDFQKVLATREELEARKQQDAQ